MKSSLRSFRNCFAVQKPMSLNGLANQSASAFDAAFSAHSQFSPHPPVGYSPPSPRLPSPNWYMSGVKGLTWMPRLVPSTPCGVMADTQRWRQTMDETRASHCTPQTSTFAPPRAARAAPAPSPRFPTPTLDRFLTLPLAAFNRPLKSFTLASDSWAPRTTFPHTARAKNILEV